jgi:hypothetical protein
MIVPTADGTNPLVGFIDPVASRKYVFTLTSRIDIEKRPPLHADRHLDSSHRQSNGRQVDQTQHAIVYLPRCQSHRCREIPWPTDNQRNA